MLPKPEKNKKNIQSSEQLELPENKHKRLFLSLTLFATIGLSFIFWAYRSLPHLSFNFNLPHFNFSPVESLPVENSDQWHILVQTTDSKPRSWSKNPSVSFVDSTIQTTVNSLAKISSPSSSIVSSVLPEGTEIKETISSTSDSIQYSALLTFPQKQLILLIKNDTSDLDKFKSSLPLVVETLYWSLLKTF